MRTIEDIKAQLKADYDKALNDALKTLEELRPVKTVSYLDKPKKVDKSIRPKYERWKPGYEEHYWYFSDVNRLITDIWIESKGDEYRFDNFNCFKSEEEAGKERDIRQVWLELREFARKANARVRSNPKWVETKAYSYNVYGVTFLWSKDHIDAQRHFCDRLKLLGEM